MLGNFCESNGIFLLGQIVLLQGLHKTEKLWVESHCIYNIDPAHEHFSRMWIVTPMILVIFEIIKK